MQLDQRLSPIQKIGLCCFWRLVPLRCHLEHGLGSASAQKSCQNISYFRLVACVRAAKRATKHRVAAAPCSPLHLLWQPQPPVPQWMVREVCMVMIAGWCKCSCSSGSENPTASPHRSETVNGQSHRQIELPESANTSEISTSRGRRQIDATG